ncbi:MAG: hypothetical protein U0892_10430 [Pirellulales bacterium]
MGRGDKVKPQQSPQENEFQEHWLSAYLDNELDDEQRAIVELRLAGDPEAQELLDDLRRVRNMVGELPRLNVPAKPFDLNLLGSAEYSEEEEPAQQVEQAATPSSSNHVVESSSQLITKTVDRTQSDRPRSDRFDEPSNSTKRWWSAFAALAASLIISALALPYLLGPEWSIPGLAYQTPGNGDASPSTGASSSEAGLGAGNSEQQNDKAMEELRSNPTPRSITPGQLESGNMPGSANVAGGLGGMGGGFAGGGLGSAPDAEPSAPAAGLAADNMPPRPMMKSAADAVPPMTMQSRGSAPPSARYEFGATSGDVQPRPAPLTIEPTRDLVAASDPAPRPAPAASVIPEARNLQFQPLPSASKDMNRSSVVNIQDYLSQHPIFAYSPSWTAADVESGIAQTAPYVRGELLDAEEAIQSAVSFDTETRRLQENASQRFQTVYSPLPSTKTTDQWYVDLQGRLNLAAPTPTQAVSALGNMSVMTNAFQAKLQQPLNAEQKSKSDTTPEAQAPQSSGMLILLVSQSEAATILRLLDAERRNNSSDIGSRSSFADGGDHPNASLSSLAWTALPKSSLDVKSDRSAGGSQSRSGDSNKVILILSRPD